MQRSYAIGIDFGSANRGMAFAEAGPGSPHSPPEVGQFRVPQLMNPGEMREGPPRASAPFLRGEGEVARLATLLRDRDRQPRHGLSRSGRGKPPSPPEVGQFGMPQLMNRGEVREEPPQASALFLPGEADFPAGAPASPWKADP